MSSLEGLEVLFVIWAFLFQVILIVHFALRKWQFETAMRFGPFVYAMGIPSALVSLLLLLGGRPWYLWIGGFICLTWASFGYWVEYVKKIEWRNPIRWSIFGPYIFLYLATIMFYWWPLARIGRPLWFVYTTLFIISTTLNLASHKGIEDGSYQHKELIG